VKPSFDANALERRIRQKVQGVLHDFWVVCHPGFERVIAEELREILQNSPSFVKGSMNIAFGGIGFSGRIEDCWRVNALARTPSRISLRIAEFSALQFAELVRKVSMVPWELYLSPHAEGQIQVTSRNSKLIHTDAIEERVAAGIAQRLAPWRETLPVEDHGHKLPQTVLVRFEGNVCTLSLDSSGELLFRRGYGKYTEDAPLRDTLAACMLRLAHAQECTHLIDPMAGSGTFTLEALLSRMPNGIPGLLRRFAFEEWPCFRAAAYQHYRKSLQQIPGEAWQAIQISDLDSKAMQTIRTNIQAMAGEIPPVVQLTQRDFFAAPPPLTSPANQTLVMLNPPYGIRLSQGDQSLFARIGDHLRKHYAGCRFAIICPTPEDLHALQFSRAKQVLSKNGGLEIAILYGTIGDH